MNGGPESTKLRGLTSVDKFFRIFSTSSGETVSRM